MSKKILFAVIFGLTLSAGVAVANAEPMTAKTAKTTKKNPAPEPKRKDENRKVTVITLSTGREPGQTDVPALADTQAANRRGEKAKSEHFIILAVED